MTSTTSPLILLENRQIIKISGNDRYDFIQGLITNDIELLKSQDSLYACMLTPQGKFLFEFFIFENGDTLFLDTEKHRIEECIKRLKMYKLRANIDITLDETLNCYAHLEKSDDFPETLHIIKDPRHPDIDHRIYTNQKLANESLSFDEYDIKRIQLELPDGSRDMVPERSTMAEARMDQINGVSYTKGCYVGQEVTARMHHRGLAKKKLTSLKKTDGKKWLDNEQIEIDGKNIGHITSSCKDYALALIKCDAKNNANKSTEFTFLA